jgi:hypothetical protein
MPRDSHFQATFDTLRATLRAHSKQLLVQVDKPGDFQVAWPTRTDRIGRPLFVAAVQIKKNYVTYHLMPVYAVPHLLRTLSPALKKRMQGKSCFNFTSIDREQVRELSALTKTGIAAMRDIDLPWAKTSK